jgi:phosphoglycolate phosphatase
MPFQNNNFSNIVFDLDGTLIDSASSILKCIQSVVQKNGYFVNIKFDSRLIGPPLRDILKQLTKEKNIEKLDALIEQFKNEYDQGICNLATPYFGIDKLLLDLNFDNKNVYIVTNKRYMPANSIISYLKWNKFIKQIYTIDYPNPQFKDKSQVLTQLLLDFALDRNRTCYIGDRDEDRLAADNCGLKFFSVEWGYGNPKSGVSRNIESLMDPDHLRSLLINSK